jgi:hypothetical protein
MKQVFSGSTGNVGVCDDLVKLGVEFCDIGSTV